MWRRFSLTLALFFILVSGSFPVARAAECHPAPLGIWEPSPLGVGEERRGRTDAELDRHEAATGYRLPALYRAHMKAQNGGDVRFRAYRQGDFFDGLFLNGEEMAPLEEARTTMKDFLGNYFTEADMPGQESDVASPLSGGRLERLFILSYMDWHRLLCLDYGYDRQAPLAEPRVVLFNMEELTEDFRAASYEAFVKGLVYYTEEGSPEVYYTLRPQRDALSLDAVADRVARAWRMPFLRVNEDGRYAGYHPWFSSRGEHDGGAYHVMLQANAYRSGTRPFPERDAPFILSVEWYGKTPEECLDFVEKRRESLEKEGLTGAFLLMSGGDVATGRAP